MSKNNLTPTALKTGGFKAIDKSEADKMNAFLAEYGRIVGTVAINNIITKKGTT